MKKSKQMNSNPVTSKDVQSESRPRHEEIAALARSFWEESGRPEGRDMEHWLLAETQIREQHGQKFLNP
jgi:hypothetical protein